MYNYVAEELTLYNKRAATTMIIMATTMGTMITHAATPSSEPLPRKFGGTPTRFT